MLSSLRAVAPRRISCSLRSQSTLTLSPRSLLSKQSGQCTIPSLLVSLNSHPNSISNTNIRRRNFHTSQPQRQEAAHEEANGEDGGAEDVLAGLPTAKSAALDKLSNKLPGSGRSGGTLNADGQETTFTGLRDNGLIDKRVMDTIVEDMGYVEMTDVQIKTITPSLGSRDILAQARTGTGKTMAFLLPTIQKLLQNKIKSAPSPEDSDHRLPRSFGGQGVIDIRALIISPTRELALQIEKEAQKLIKNTSLKVQSAVGGTGKRDAMLKMRREGCDILVATPGRLVDSLQDRTSPIKVPNLDVYVLDEADSLLDQGFSQALVQINQELPDRRDHDRQTLFYSATFSKSVEKIARQTLKRDAVFINTVDPNEQPTHARVPQYSLVVKSFENVLPTLLELVGRERELAKEEGKPFKAMVFCNTTRGCTFNANVFRLAQHHANKASEEHKNQALANIEIHEIQGRLEQEQRSRVAERFRKAHEAIMFTSDVTARGMDFPNVTHIIQVGLMMSQEAYIHRIGRTARGASTTTGKGFLITTTSEYKGCMDLLDGIPIKREEYAVTDPLRLKCCDIDMSAASTIDRKTADILTTVTEAAVRVKESDKADMYTAMLGYYKGQRVDIGSIIGQMGRMCRFQWGMEKPVPVGSNLLIKMGISKQDQARYDVNTESRPYLAMPETFNSRNSYTSQNAYGSAGGLRPDSIDRDGRSRNFSGGDRGGSFGGDRPPRRDFGDRSSSSGRGGYGDRGRGGSSRGGFGGGSYRGGSFGSDRPPRRDFGDRGGSSSFGDRPPRGNFSSRGGSSGGRGGFGDRDQSKRFSRGGSRDRY